MSDPAEQILRIKAALEQACPNIHPAQISAETPSTSHVSRRRIVENLLVGSLGGTLSSALIASWVEETHARQEKRVRHARAWRQALGLGGAPRFFIADDFSLYPNSNRWSQQHLRTPDPRALAVANAVNSFITAVDPTFSSKPTNAEFIDRLDGPDCVVFFGSTIVNRALRKVIGGPFERASKKASFASVDRLWRADLAIGQYTPTDRVMHGVFNGDVWDYWNHELWTGHESVTSDFGSRHRDPSEQTSCYFHITKLTSPPLRKGKTQTVLMLTPLHERGANGLLQLFDPHPDSAASTFITELQRQGPAELGSWQAVGRVSRFNSQDRAGRFELVSFFPIQTNLT